MKRKGLIVFLIVILVVLNIGTLTFLWLHRPAGHPAPGGRDVSGFLVKELLLSDPQQQEYYRLRELNHQEMEELRRQDRALHKIFFDQLIAVPRDSIAVENLADSIAILRKKMELLTFNHFIKVRKILRPEQQKKFDTIFHDALRMILPPPPPPIPPPPPPPGR